MIVRPLLFTNKSQRDKTMKTIMKTLTITLVLGGVNAPSVWASPVTIPNTFTSDTPAYADQVNDNFSAIKTAVDDNDARITANTSANQIRDRFFAGTSCTNPNNPNDIMVKVGPICVDKYEASIWQNPDGTGTAYGVLAGQTAYPLATFPFNGNWTAPLYAASVPSVMPSTFVTWFQAQQACALSGKRLLSNAEWQMAAAGTTDLGTDNGTTECNNITAGLIIAAGSRSVCVSNWGAHDMVGNASEWVADWVQGDTSTYTPSVSPGTAEYGSDLMLGVNRATNQSVDLHMPAALTRGGDSGSSTDAGVFSMDATRSPQHSSLKGGFRCGM